MSEHKSMLEPSLKSDQPTWEEKTYETLSSMETPIKSVKVDTIAVEMPRAKEFIKDLNKANARITRIRDEVLIQKASAGLRPFITTEDDGLLVVVPSCVYTNDDIRMVMIQSLLNALDLNPRVYEGQFEASETTGELRNFAAGIITQTDKDLIKNPISLNGAMTAIQTGRSLVWAQIIKRKFSRMNAEKFLRKNNRFFGNGETDEEKKTSYVLKRINVLFEGAKDAKSYIDLTVDLIHRLGDAVPVSMATLSKYTITFKDMMDSFKRPVYTLKKGKQVLTGYKRPKKPSRSPVFSKEENEEIFKLLNPVWDSLSCYEQDWGTLDITDIADFYACVEGLIKHRWDLLQRYSKMTTKRLEDIRRNIKENEKSKKKDITSDIVSTYLKKVAAPRTTLTHIRYLAKTDTDFKSMIEFRLNASFKTVKEAEKAYVSYLSSSIYKIEDEKSPDLEPRFNQSELKQLDYIARDIITIKRKSEEFMKQARALVVNKERLYKAAGSAIHVQNIGMKIATAYNKLQGLPQQTLRHAVYVTEYFYGINLHDYLDFDGNMKIDKNILKFINTDMRVLVEGSHGIAGVNVPSYFGSF
jgi:hypothetical protein